MPWRLCYISCSDEFIEKAIRRIDFSRLGLLSLIFLHRHHHRSFAESTDRLSHANCYSSFEAFVKISFRSLLAQVDFIEWLQHCCLRHRELQMWSLVHAFRVDRYFRWGVLWLKFTFSFASNLELNRFWLQLYHLLLDCVHQKICIVWVYKLYDLSLSLNFFQFSPLSSLHALIALQAHGRIFTTQSRPQLKNIAGQRVCHDAILIGLLATFPAHQLGRLILRFLLLLPSRSACIRQFHRWAFLDRLWCERWLAGVNNWFLLLLCVEMRLVRWAL